MTDIKAKLKTLFKDLLSHPVCLSNTAILALTTGFEQAWETVALKCPEKPPNVDWYSSNQCYSVVFILAPALTLWMIGILGSNVAWRICQGLKYRKEPHECGCKNITAIALRTVLVPLVWMFVALMDGDFYACFMYLPSCSEGVSLIHEGSSLVDGVNCTNDITAWTYEKKFQSQLIGWAYLLGCFIFGTCVVFCGRRLSKRTYFPQLYSNKLRREERMQIEKLLKEQAEKDGKRNAGAFIMRFASQDQEPVPASYWESITRESTKEECKSVTNTKTDKEQKATPEQEQLTRESTKEECKSVTNTKTDKEQNATPEQEQQTATGQEQQAATEELVYHSPLSEFLNDKANKKILVDFDLEAKKAQSNKTNNQIQPNETNNQIQPNETNN